MNSRYLILSALLLSMSGLVLFGQGPAAAKQNPVKQGNSHEKIRVVPNALAARIGSAIPWETDFAAAMQKSKQSNKPLLWYVPRLANTFMDRKKEIDRYMRAGPFSNPRIIASIREHYIPLLSVPQEDEAKRFDLQPFKFVEPGFLVVDPDGSASFTIDRLTTLHSHWLTQFFKAPRHWPPPSETLQRARQRLSAGDYQACRVAGEGVSPGEVVELQMISAMATFRLGEHAAAIEKFASIGESFPQHPLGWKAAAEAQRIGPFVRGFEVFRELPAKAMSAGRKSLGSAAPSGTYTEPQLWQRGIEFLLSMQNEAGGVVDSDYDYGGTDGLPNVHVAVTSLVAMAWVRCRDQEQFQDLRPRIDRAISKAVTYVNDPANLNERDTDEVFWAYLYRLQLMNLLYEERLINDIDAVQKSLDSLTGIQLLNGDWSHEYNNPFVTASALWAIKDSQRLGVEVAPLHVSCGIGALKRCRFTNGAWSYQSARGRREPLREATRQQLVSSAGRMPLCEGALVIWGHAKEKRLVESIETAFQLHDALDAARKYDDHTSSYSYGGFFYWYDMQTRIKAINQISDAKIRDAFAARLRKQVMSVPEIDGCFVDSHEIGRSYGTAVALLCLSGCGTEDDDAVEDKQ